MATDGYIANRYFPWAYAGLTTILVLAGWLAIYGCEQLTAGSGRLFRQQVVWSVLGISLMLVVGRCDYRRCARVSLVAFLAVVVLLVAVYAFPAINGAQRWIRIGGVGIQPSEFAKIAFILALSAHLMHRDIAVGFIRGLLVPLALASLPMLLIVREPDLGTALVFLPVMLTMLFAAGARLRDLVRVVAIGTLLVPLVWTQMSREQRSRVTALWEQNLPRESPTADGFHLDQAKRMFALGGVWGQFLATEAGDESSATRVPEPYTDSIYCVIGERFGLIGAAVIVLLYFFLVGACLRVARRTDEPFGRLISVGVAALFSTEVLINTGMMVGLLPITGLSLPLVSYGGSDLIAHLLAIGMVMSVARAIPRFPR